MRWPGILTAAVGLAAGLLAAAVALSPRIVSVSPIGTANSAREPITVQFSRPVAAGQEEAKFRIEPPVAGELILQGDRLVFTPTEPLVYGQLYRLRIGGLLRPATGVLPVWLGKSWEFTVGPPRLVYLRQEGGVANLWLREASGESRPLTAEPHGIWDYQVLPDGQGVLAAVEDAAGRDLVRYGLDGGRDLILDCGADACQSGQWQPNGALVAYERGADGGAGPTEVWMLDTETGRDTPAHEPAMLADAGYPTRASHSPRWSAEGRYLAYFKSDARLIVILDLAGREEPRLVPANLDLMGDWSPTGRQLAYTELAFGVPEPHAHEDESGAAIPHEESGLFSHLVVTNLETGDSTDLSAGLEVDDGRPGWAPGGDRLTFSRTETGGGRQIWVVALDESAARPLTSDPLLGHSSLAWSPDGKRLAYMRQDLARPGSPPAIWLRDVETGHEELAAEGAYSPAWLP